jgi:hypothetical protein
MFNRVPTFHVGADILWTWNILCRRKCFHGLRIFHERRHFMNADILGADILGRRHLGRRHFRALTF